MDEDDSYEYFNCKTEDAKVISNVLLSLSVNQRKEQSCFVCSEEESLTFSVTSRSKATRAKVSMDAGLFDEYSCKPAPGCGSITFGMSLTTLLDCLTLTSNPDETSVTMTYERRDAIFRLTLEEAGVQTVCDLTVMHCDDTDDSNNGLTSAFMGSEEEANIIMNSDSLKEAVAELIDTVGATEVRVEVVRQGDALCQSSSSSSSSSSSHPFLANGMLGSAHKLGSHIGGLVLSAAGNAEECEMVLPADSDNIFVSFKCQPQRVAWVYPLTSFQLGMKALSVANETYLRINSEGIMALQHQIDTGHASDTYVDFLMVALNRGMNRQEETSGVTERGAHEDACDDEKSGRNDFDTGDDDPFSRPFSSRSFGSS